MKQETSGNNYFPLLLMWLTTLGSMFLTAVSYSEGSSSLVSFVFILLVPVFVLIVLLTSVIYAAVFRLRPAYAWMAAFTGGLLAFVPLFWPTLVLDIILPDVVS